MNIVDLKLKEAMIWIMDSGKESPKDWDNLFNAFYGIPVHQEHFKGVKFMNIDEEIEKKDSYMIDYLCEVKDEKID